jgi:ABC-type transport system involved in multi-copper enzyme maturation permease subunit
MNSAAWWTIAKKDVRDMRRSGLFITLLVGLCVLILASIIVSSVAFHSQVADYQNYLDALKAAGSTATPANAPEFYPLQQLIGGIEYLEIIGALLAIVIGYGIITKEKSRGTLLLLLSRPLRSKDVAVGKLVALAVTWLVFSAVIGLGMVIILLVIGGAQIAGLDYIRIAETVALSAVYLFFWSALGLGLAAWAKQPSTALIIGLVLWLVVVLILPQIGDTMDPDNQVPGGLFNSLQVARPQQHDIMAHFSGYENGRNDIESASVEKHFERATFGFTGIKPIYNQQSLGYVFAHLWGNIVTVCAFALTGTFWAVWQCSKKRLLRKESL